MPGFDGTGPWGMGPRTGGGFGFCAPGSGPVPYRSGPGVGYGVGRGGRPWGGGRGRAFGGGRGWMWRAAYPYGAGPYWGYPAGQEAAPADERAFLENELAYMEQQIEAIRSRLAEIEGASSAE
ncbi:MAG: DUF5320 domain-containing protein [bacterium]